MLIASWPLQDFAGFLQIISWIILPVLCIAVISTIAHHYYQRRRNKQYPDDAEHVAALARMQANRHYRDLKTDFETLQAAYRANEEELQTLNSEMKRQDFVIDQLRCDVATLEKNLGTLRLALQFKEEQLQDLQNFLEESKMNRPFQPSVIAAEIS